MTGLVEVEISWIQERIREFVDHRRKTSGNLSGRLMTSKKKEHLVLPTKGEAEFLLVDAWSTKNFRVNDSSEL